jgi:hypothetical protein
MPSTGTSGLCGGRETLHHYDMTRVIVHAKAGGFVAALLLSGPASGQLMDQVGIFLDPEAQQTDREVVIEDGAPTEVVFYIMAFNTTRPISAFGLGVDFDDDVDGLYRHQPWDQCYGIAICDPDDHEICVGCAECMTPAEKMVLIEYHFWFQGPMTLRSATYPLCLRPVLDGTFGYVTYECADIDRYIEFTMVGTGCAALTFTGAVVTTASRSFGAVKALYGSPRSVGG